MEYIEVSLPGDFRAQAIYDSYCRSFPEDERRDDDQFRALFSNPKVKVLMVLDELQDVGYLVCWELTDFVFVEHFEIFPKFRSKKYGSQIIQDLCKNYTHIVLEVEPADLTDDANRRLSFYKKNGFSVIDSAYIQPSYHTDKNPLDLWLLANWTPEKTDWIKEELYDVVYR